MTMDLDKSWDKVKKASSRLLTINYIPQSDICDLHQEICSMCYTYPLAEELHEKMITFLNNHVTNIYENMLRADDVDLLQTYQTSWTKYKEGAIHLNNIFRYLNSLMSDTQQNPYQTDRTKFKTRPKPEIGELCIKSWKNILVARLRQSLFKQVVNSITSDCDGLFCPEVTLDFINSLIEIRKNSQKDVYEIIFEKPFLNWLGNRYRVEANRLVRQCSVSDYTVKMLEKLSKLEATASKCFNVKTVNNVLDRCRIRMVIEKLNFLLSEFKLMMKQDMTKSLSNLYLLLKDIPEAIKLTVDEVYEYIKEEGLRLVAIWKKDNNYFQFVEDFIDVHTKYRQLISVAFFDDSIFVDALNRSLTDLLNNNTDPNQKSKNPELLAKYCASLLKNSKRRFTEEEVNDKLTRSITMFRYTTDKDMFYYFYAESFVRRLLYQHSFSMNAEENMIFKLTEVCGARYTSKLRCIFKAISCASDLNKHFACYLITHNIQLEMTFFAYVLQVGSIPFESKGEVDFKIPMELEKAVQTFGKFYRHIHSSKTLALQFHLTQVEVKLTYLKKNYVVVMQTYQLAIILLFKDHDSLTVKDIKDCLQLTSKTLYKNINSLVRSNLLLSDTAEVTDDSTLSLNLDYENKHMKVQIGGPAGNNATRKKVQTIEAVDEERQNIVKTAIVKIMKSRKVLDHDDLIQLVFAASHGSFKPNISIIENCIELLIQAQYIKRNPNIQSEYRYIA